MPITAEQRIQRSKYLGSSDAAAVLGLDPFKSATDVYWSKVIPVPPDKPTKSMDAGNLLEGPLLTYAARVLGVEIDRNPPLIVAEDGILAASVDALVIGRPEGVEAKYSGGSEDWGTEGTDEIPERVMIQCQHQAYTCNLERVWVPALVIGFRAEFRLYCVQRHEGLIKEIVNRLLAFWHENVIAGVPPDGVQVPPLASVRSRRRDPESIIHLDESAIEVWNKYEEAKDSFNFADATKEQRQAAVLDMLGSAEAATLPDGRMITYYEQKSPPKTDLVILRARYPEAARECVNQGVHRSLKIKTTVKKPKRGGALA